MEAELRARPAATVRPAGMLAALQDPATVLAVIAHHAQETLAARAEAVEAKAEAVVTRQPRWPRRRSSRRPSPRSRPTTT